MKIEALCHTCRHRHAIEFDPLAGPANQFSDWQTKHAGHGIEYRWPRRDRKKDRRRKPGLPKQWEHYLHNADVKVSYAASAAFTITLASLATSSTLTAGQESTAVSNASNKYLDYMIGGKITTGTTPTDAKSIQIWAYGAVEDDPIYPDVMDGTDSAETVTSADIRNAGLNFLIDTATNNTSDRTYWFRPVSLAAAFGGLIPPAFGLWVTHDTAVNLNSTGGNHALYYTGIFCTVT